MSETRSFELLGRSVRCEDAPWEDGSGGYLTIPAFVEDRMRTQDTKKSRMMAWGVVHIAVARAISEDSLFRRSGLGRCFTLIPDGPAPSSVPLQRIHVGPKAIPNALANIPCSNLNVQDLLDMLNDIHDTHYTLNQLGLQECLQHVLDKSTDFGQAYGYLRPWWMHDFAAVLYEMGRREKADRDLRSRAIQESCVVEPRMPPRRVWDLYSDRVLPFYALPTPTRYKSNFIPNYVWAVSHSWAQDSDRSEVWTPTNGQQWPVPIPCDTTLDHVRIELLNLGAEYVWLDVLCLRQRGRDEDEAIRREEWKLDVPTIGNIYRGNWGARRVCITYFNGLGRPLDTNTRLLESSRHWFNRVWTLQELCEEWLPGGLTGQPLVDGRSFFDRFQREMNDASKSDMPALLRMLQGRSCTTELDKIAGLAYLLSCETLPIYDESVALEFAWRVLIKHLPPAWRTAVFLEPSDSLDDCSLQWVSWRQISQRPPTIAMGVLGDEALKLVDESQCYTYEPARFVHESYALGPCRIRREPDAKKTATTEEVWLDFDGHEPVNVRLAIHCPVSPDTYYTLLGVAYRLRVLILAEVVGETGAEGNKALEAVKRGIMYMERSEGEKLMELKLGRANTKVMYLTDEEVLARGLDDVHCSRARHS